MTTSKESTPSFVATIRLKTNKKEEQLLLMLSDCGRQLYNACLGKCLNRLRAIQNTDLYKGTIRLSKTSKVDLAKRKSNFKALNELWLYGLLHSVLRTKTKNDSKFIEEHLGAHVCQNISQEPVKLCKNLPLKKPKR